VRSTPLSRTLMMRRGSALEADAMATTQGRGLSGEHLFASERTGSLSFFSSLR
jgi:hypothetical protein